MNIKFGLAAEIPTDNGSRIVLVTSARSVPGYSTTEFTVAEFKVVTGAEGEGRLHEAASLKFPPQGGFDIDGFFGEPTPIVNLHRTK